MKKLILLCLCLPMLAVAQVKLEKNNAREYVNAVLWQQYSAEYRALAFQAYNFAQLSLKEQLWKNSNGRKNAVVVDVDETVLDNSKYQGSVIPKGISFDTKTWEQWTSLGIADTVPGALAFLKFAASKNVEVFYVTNRSKAEYAGTMKNLKDFGFPYADDAHLLLMDETSNKEPRRQQILKDYNILLFCGDNLSDFSNVFYREGKDAIAEVNQAQALFGTKYIVLPNAMYGDWEKLIISDPRLKDIEKSKLRIDKLKSYEL